MKMGGSEKSKSPSQLIDARIKELGDWRGEMLSRLRALSAAALELRRPRVTRVFYAWRNAGGGSPTELLVPWIAASSLMVEALGRRRLGPTLPLVGRVASKTSRVGVVQ